MTPPAWGNRRPRFRSGARIIVIARGKWERARGTIASPLCNRREISENGENYEWWDGYHVAIDGDTDKPLWFAPDELQPEDAGGPMLCPHCGVSLVTHRRSDCLEIQARSSRARDEAA